MLPRQDPFIKPSRVVYDSCAVVGSSGMHLFHRRGDFIDSHEAVIRFNAAPTVRRVRVRVRVRVRFAVRVTLTLTLILTITLTLILTITLILTLTITLTLTLTSISHATETGRTQQAGFEEFVGSKTTVRFVNRLHFGFQERPSEAVLQQVTTPEG